jgi:hypothetical protein
LCAAFYPLFTSFVHGFFSNLLTPLPDFLLSQALQKGGLQKCTKVDSFRGGVGGGGRFLRLALSSRSARILTYKSMLRCGPNAISRHPSKIVTPPPRGGTDGCGRAPPACRPSGVGRGSIVKERGRFTEAPGTGSNGPGNLFRAFQTDRHRRVRPSKAILSWVPRLWLHIALLGRA